VQGDYNVLKLTAKAGDVLFNDERVFLKSQKEKIEKKLKRSLAYSDGPSDAPVGEFDEALFMRLRRLRKRLADEQDIPPYIIFSDASLRDMAGRKPSSLDEFRGISGVGDRKLEMYGTLFVDEIVDHLNGA
jgi:ATP-dependent DNA helicase RecQ